MIYVEFYDKEELYHANTNKKYPKRGLKVLLSEIVDKSLMMHGISFKR